MGVARQTGETEGSERSTDGKKKRIPSRLLARVGTWFAINVVAFCALLAADFATNLSSLKWWADAFAVATNLLSGGLVSFLLYFLVVYLPERRKKAIIKTNLLRMYRDIKQEILWAVVHASIKGGRRDLVPNSDTVDRLMSPKGFKDAFKHGRQANEGFYAFENQMSDDTPEFRTIVLNLQMLSKQIEFVLHNYIIEDQGVFDYFKRLELFLMRIQTNGPGYDESKQLCGFIWEVCAGWNMLRGDIGHDTIEKTISDL
jgi:hypothetical protein